MPGSRDNIVSLTVMSQCHITNLNPTLMQPTVNWKVRLRDFENTKNGVQIGCRSSMMTIDGERSYYKYLLIANICFPWTCLLTLSILHETFLYLYFCVCLNTEHDMFLALITFLFVIVISSANSICTGQSAVRGPVTVINFNSSLIEILFAQLLFGCGPGHWYLSQLPAARPVWLMS